MWLHCLTYAVARLAVYQREGRNYQPVVHAAIAPQVVLKRIEPELPSPAVVTTRAVQACRWVALLHCDERRRVIHAKARAHDRVQVAHQLRVGKHARERSTVRRWKSEHVLQIASPAIWVPSALVLISVHYSVGCGHLLSRQYVAHDKVTGTTMQHHRAAPPRAVSQGSGQGRQGRAGRGLQTGRCISSPPSTWATKSLNASHSFSQVEEEGLVRVHRSQSQLKVPRSYILPLVQLYSWLGT